MSRRATIWLAWSLWAVTLALVVGSLLLGVANRPEAPLYEYWVESALISPTFATLGALIVSHRPENVIGWIFCVSSIAGGVQLFSGQYATVALFSSDAQLPSGTVAAWLSTIMQTSVVAAALFLIMLFPTGRLLSSRWRTVAWTAGLAITISLVSLALRPGPIRDFRTSQNPFGVEGAVILAPVEALGGVLFLVCFAAAILSLIVRFYRSQGEERLQLKWFAYAAALGFTAILSGTFFDLPAVDERIDAFYETLVWTVAPLSLPVSAGIAILRYRLYNIDLIINRTLVYGALTTLLVAVYVGSIVVLQGLLRALTGQESQLAIVISTLMIAALFNPLRRRVQGFIDRRFYRRKYDARKALEAFSATLRDETDLAALRDDLVNVIRETMQPTHVSLWLRPDRGSTRSEGNREPLG